MVPQVHIVDGGEREREEGKSTFIVYVLVLLCCLLLASP